MGWISRRHFFWVDDDLKKTESAVETTIRDRTFSPTRAPAALDTLVELLRDVAKTEFDRESNLNTRAAAVAAVAGLIATASGAVGKAVFSDKTLTGANKDVALALMLIGLVAVISALVMVVIFVLRPKQAKTRQTFFTDAVVEVWRERGDSAIILGARREGLYQVYVDRLLRTIALWSVRNREKSRWLGRAWVCLGLGIVLIGATGVLVASVVLDYSILTTVGMVAGGLLLVYAVLKGAYHKGRNQQVEEDKRNTEVEAILSFLSGTPTRRAPDATP
jgi:hypothetical protein